METATNYRYIVKTEGIRGGRARIEGTRIGVHDVIGLLQNGETIDSISNCFPDINRIAEPKKRGRPLVGVGVAFSEGSCQLPLQK
jgi:uncharacterized protein (DUF433 family)